MILSKHSVWFSSAQMRPQVVELKQTAEGFLGRAYLEFVIYWGLSQMHYSRWTFISIFVLAAI